MEREIPSPSYDFMNRERSLLKGEISNAEQAINDIDRDSLKLYMDK
jgi:hypothetical protein